MARIHRYPTRSFGLQRAQTAALAAQQVQQQSDVGAVAGAVEAVNEAVAAANEAVATVNETLVTVNATLSDYGTRISELEQL